MIRLDISGDDRGGVGHDSPRAMTPTLDLAGQIAVVTGAGGGIGRAVCRAFLDHGATVIMADLNPHDIDPSVGASGPAQGRVERLAMDVTSEASVTAAFDHIATAHGAPDILVNNAGLSIRKGLNELTLGEWERVFAVNVTGAFLCSRAAAALMRPRGRGAIVSVGSIMGLSGGGPYPNPSYQASKGALVNLTRGLAVELAPAGIRVNAVAPTWVRTAFISELLKDEARLAGIAALMPMGRIAEPEEVAAATLFLASGMAAMITGHTLPIDGGYLSQ
ncbi:MAG: SDR family oxidoreductase [Pseudomonadota bacterium]